MPKQVHFLLKLDQETAYELQGLFRRTELDFPTFLKEVIKMGLGKYDLFLYPGTRAEYDAEVEDAFMLEWTIEREEKEMEADDEQGP